MYRGHRGTLDPTVVGVGWSGKDIPVGGEYDVGGGQVWVREAIPGRGDSVNKDTEASSSKEWLRVAETASSGQGVAGDTTRGVSKGRNQRALVDHCKFSHHPGEPMWSSGRMTAGGRRPLPW